MRGDLARRSQHADAVVNRVRMEDPPSIARSRLAFSCGPAVASPFSSGLDAVACLDLCQVVRPVSGLLSPSPDRCLSNGQLCVCNVVEERMHVLHEYEISSARHTTTD